MDSRKRNVRVPDDQIGDKQSADLKATAEVTRKRLNRTPLASEWVFLWLLVLATTMVAVSHVAIELYLDLPSPADLRTADFDYRNARTHLEKLTGFGPRLVGSYENEILAPEYLMGELEKIRSKSLNSELYEMEFEIWRSVGGSFRLDFLHDYISVYRNITSVVLRILPKHKVAESALLINCHYDTVADSPGAGDDASSCAVMLEMSRAIVSDSKPLQNGLIFLWNGAEENMLQASHAFVTQHRWFLGKPKVSAFVNLDAAGSSGREIAFQIGPENPWLIEAYAQSVSLPWASIMAQEFFESGLIPSDTDYRQFRDFGKLPGVDLAFVQNGYVYHTEHDTADRVKQQSLHRAGTNVLALIRTVTNSSLLGNPGSQRFGKVVFFDVLGHFMVVYPKSVAAVLNILVCLVVFLVALKPKISAGSPFGSRYKWQLLRMLGLIVAKILLSIVAVSVVGFLLSRVGRHSMAWYSHYWPALVYLLPMFIVELLLTAHSRQKGAKTKPQPTSVVRLEQMHFDAFQLLLILLTLLFTVAQLGSAYFPMLFLLNSFLVRNVLFDRIYLATYRSGEKTDATLAQLTLVNWLSFSLVIAQAAYMSRTFSELLVPIMGRSGSEVNCEVFYGCLLILTSIWPVLSQSGLLFRVRFDRVLPALCAMFVCVFALLCFTDLGFPYYLDAQTKQVFTKRVLLSHTSRHLVLDDKLVENKTYLWVTSLDSLGMEPLRDYFHPTHVDLDNSLHHRCDSEFWPYCGVPTIYPAALLVRPQWLVNIPQSLYPVRTIPQLKLVSTEQVGSNAGNTIIRQTFELHNTPSHSTLYIANRYGSKLVQWTFWAGENPDVYDDPHPAYSVNTVDQATGNTYERRHNFVYYSHGTTPQSPLKFALEFSVQAGLHGKVALAELAFAAMYMQKPECDTQFQKEVRELLPEWISELSWGTHYDARTLHAIVA